MSHADQTTDTATNTSIPKWFLNATSVLAIPAITLIGWLVVSVVQLQAQVGAAEQDREKIAAVLEDQTRELIALRLEIERLLIVKPADVFRKLEELEKRWQQLDDRLGRDINTAEAFLEPGRHGQI